MENEICSQNLDNVQIHNSGIFSGYFNEYDSVCEKHGKTKGFKICIVGKIFEGHCKQCWDEDVQRRQTEIDKAIKIPKTEIWKNRGIREEYFSKTLENYKAETESEKTALQAINLLKEGKLGKVLLLGDMGTGKTHLASALLKDFDGIYLTMFELGLRFESAFKNGISKFGVLREILSKQLVVIDEIGYSKGTTEEECILSYIVDYAHTQNIRLILISNKYLNNSGKVKLKEGDYIFHYLNQSVFSRFQSRSAIVEVHGRDRRSDITVQTGIFL